ncbi:MAG TPA: HAD-IA family hydrolase [Candidatus Polarisedimenticolaceae bacterium]|nr:HAD-IA family hydrolase [Candidatus Polarisedimenticolaceae bacterium]
MTARRTRGIVFDLDGTLIDSYPAITESVNRAREGHGLSPLPADVVRAHVGRGLPALIADLVGPAHVEEGVRLFRERYAEVYATGTLALPHARTVVEALVERGYGLAVASNKPARFAEAILSTLGMRPAFRAVLGPDLAGTTKPEPTMLRLCREALGVERHETLYVGDMVLDVETAREAGVPVVLVPGGSSSPEALRETGQPVLADLRELLSLLPPRPPTATGLTHDIERA